MGLGVVWWHRTVCNPSSPQLVKRMRYLRPYTLGYISRPWLSTTTTRRQGFIMSGEVVCSLGMRTPVRNGLGGDFIVGTL